MNTLQPLRQQYSKNPDSTYDIALLKIKVDELVETVNELIGLATTDSIGDIPLEGMEENNG